MRASYDVSMAERSWITDVGEAVLDLVRGIVPARDDAVEPSPVIPAVAGPPPEAALAEGQPGPPEPDVVRTGVVWVHGIGTQKAGESLFDWTRPMLDVLAGWRRDRDERRSPGTPAIGENPVRAASVSDPQSRWISVDIPAVHGRPRAEWLVTEAYWASDIRPPSFAASVGYLLGHLPMIIRGIAYGYGERRDQRKRRFALIPGQTPDDRQQRELRKSDRRLWKITDFLDWIWSTPFLRGLLMLVATVLAVIALGLYGLLHRIPIVGKKVQLAAADTFIVEWFADLSVLLDDQAQAAAVRTRVLERVRWLKRNGATHVVLLAHSGGTIVSYATLLRYDEAELPVTKLITFGEAIKLGWRLERDTDTWAEGNPVRGDLRAGHPNLRWVDFWASYDPAPGGPLEPVDGCPLRAVDKLSVDPQGAEIEVESRAVTNFMHLADDHGGYWSNDEAFLIPVIRHIDDAPGTGDRARFYTDPIDRAVRIERRRRRVSLLLGWRWTAFAAVVLSMLGLAFGGVTNAAQTGGWVATTFGFIPGHEIVTGTIDGLGKVVSTVARGFGGGGLVDLLTSWGQSILGTLVPIGAIFAIYVRGVGSWTAHDSIERRSIHAETPGPSGLASAHSEAILLLGGLVAIVLASVVGAQGIAIELAGPRTLPWVVITLLIAAPIAFVARFVLGHRPENGATTARIAAMIGRT